MCFLIHTSKCSANYEEASGNMQLMYGTVPKITKIVFCNIIQII